MGLFDLFKSQVTPAAVRAEIWRLGVRHHGEPLTGALEELTQGADADRVQLLRACVRELRRG